VCSLSPNGATSCLNSMRLTRDSARAISPIFSSIGTARGATLCSCARRARSASNSAAANTSSHVTCSSLATAGVVGRHMPPRVGAAPQLLRAFEPERGFAEMLVLEKAPHKLGPRVLQPIPFQTPSRQNHLRLDTDQQRGHFQEFASPIQTKHLDTRDRPQKLSGDVRNRNVENVDILFTDQMQQQIERAMEPVQLDDERALGVTTVCAATGQGMSGAVYSAVGDWGNASDFERRKASREARVPLSRTEP
jgi:hypothetical protein